MSDKREGYIEDFISGIQVKETPEEIEAVQPFSKILVDDYGYPKENIVTRPQWRVKVRPSDRKKEYPVDIAVFSDSRKDDSSASIIVECKKKTRKDGRSQLEDYLRFSKARFGVWFNGEERLFLLKTEEDGQVKFSEIPNIPRYGERLEDIGQFKRRDLKPAENLKPTFKTIRNYLAANAVGITRDEVFASQIINLIFCKIYDERFTRPEDTVQFRAGIGESYEKVRSRVVKLFEKVKRQYNDVIEVSDSIQFDAKSLTYVVGELQLYSLQESSRDAVGEAFEIFIGPSLKGGQGQFFTPRNVVNMVIEMLDPSRDDKILDPACGSGGFLVESLRYVWNKVETEGRELGWPVHEIEAEKQKVAIRNFRGIDKDYFLSKVAKAYLAILGDGRGGVHSENSLERWKNWGSSTKEDIRMGEFDMVITNPPFGKKLAIMSTDILEQFDLGYKWKQNDDGVFEKMTLQDKQPPQILFIERCFDFLKPGGKLGIVLLESIFGMPKYQYVVDYITSKAKILGVVAMPEDLFQPHTHAKCCVVICEKLSENEVGKIIEPYDIFMSDVKWCGHDSRGNPTYTFDEEGKRVLLDDIPKIAAQYWEMGDKR
ncbi:restriction endonuclease subunit M [Enterococcus faecalis]|uniref:restriction endonuclease subunit M n=1 Tax=Enterococcus TaxID=1350 RepID=UPI0012E1C37F|nr:N-6 DNA methylase [Enterococcus faecalis]EGO7722004.1 N-6 DNA methylase [Enterococcus faecalis]EGO9191996.1 N-6 DNA methylase [Enterococcus faecalis]EGQ7385016.1 N-6 DNA methylase [Enterococcus faecalis]EHG5973286.1 N-6 DNA methylase [Enterococcus faecalis]EHU4982095.1 N-6 DNA methylase [Enterococcus faecalis]